MGERLSELTISNLLKSLQVVHVLFFLLASSSVQCGSTHRRTTSRFPLNLLLLLLILFGLLLFESLQDCKLEYLAEDLTSTKEEVEFSCELLPALLVLASFRIVDLLKVIEDGSDL